MLALAYPTNTRILIQAFDGKAALLWLVFGVLLGMASGVFGTSAIPVTVFSIASGFGIPMYLLLIFVSGFSLLGRLPGRVGELARGDFENFERGVRSKAIRAGSSLAGLALMGGTYGAVTGSHVGGRTLRLRWMVRVHSVFLLGLLNYSGLQALQQAASDLCRNN